MNTLVTPRQAVAAERIAAETHLNETLLNIELGKADSLDLELAETRVYRSKISKVLVSVVYNGKRCAVLGIAGMWGYDTVLTLDIDGQPVEVTGKELEKDRYFAEGFVFEDFDAVIVTVADITSEAAEIFEMNRRGSGSTQVFLTSEQAEKLRDMCVKAGLRPNKAREFQSALKHYDEGNSFAYSFPCPKEKYCFLLTDAVDYHKPGAAGVLYGTDYSGQADINPLNF